MTRPTYDFRVDWNNDGDFDDTGENITSRTLGRTPVSIQYGRDQARALSPTAPGQASLEVDNRSGDYSPENPSSPLVGNVAPGRPIRIQATHSSTTYTLYRGFLDDYDLTPDPGRKSVQFTAVDALARLRGANISTDLHASVQTGQAIHLILDELDWPTTERDIDPGASTIRWWHEEGADAFAAMQRIVDAEGPSAMISVNSDGHFIFRDRHHRLLAAASLTSQATFRASGTEPLFSAPLVYDLGWRDIVNSITFCPEERNPESELSVVWQSDATFTIANGETLEIGVQGTSPFVGAVMVEGHDYTLLSGTVDIELSRTTGASAMIMITAVGGSASLTDLQLRAYALTGVCIYQVHVENGGSVAQHGKRSYGRDVPWVGRNDAVALADIILAQRAERMPIAQLRITPANDTRITQQLARDLSDRITIVEPTVGINDDFFIEQVQHTISEAGYFHETVFGCEKAVTVGGSFILDTSLLNTGTLGAAGIDDPATVFILDDGLLDTEMLAY